MSKGLFDRFADRAAAVVARAPFFAGCVLLVVLWAPSIAVIRSVDTWQLVINTATTIITFLLVALLQNTQARSEAALQQKLNALAEAQADQMLALAEVSNDDGLSAKLLDDIDTLRSAMGIEPGC